MAKNTAESVQGVLKLRLGKCLTATNRRFYADLHHVAKQVNVARTAAARAAERWWEDHPEFETWGKNPFPPKIQTEHGEIGGDTYLYHVCREAAPDIASQVMAYCSSKQVGKRLRANLPYDHVGKSKYRWQGVRNHEVARDCYRSVNIPVPKSSTVLYYAGMSSQPGTLAAEVRKRAASASAIGLTLFSTKSGRKTYAICRIETRQLPQGLRDVLRRIVRGDWKMGDSLLVERDGEWYLHLVYSQPQEDMGLDMKRVAELFPTRWDADRPFVCVGPDARWKVGDARVMLHEREAMQMRRETIMRRRDDTSGARRGHGRQRLYRDTKDISRAHNHMMLRFVERIVSETIRFCVRHNCGTLHYRNPTDSAKRKSWFGNLQINFNWCGVETRLANKCKKLGIMFDVLGWTLGDIVASNKK